MAVPRPSPRIEEFEKLAFGMFVHWGLYSLLGRGEWVKDREKIPTSEYVKLKERFTAHEYDPAHWAQAAKNAGMKYICLTTRHHDGFSLYDTRGLNDFDAPHSAARRDLVGEFTAACAANGILPFFYHTTLDWHQESFTDDFDTYLDYLHDSIEILCRNYGPIGGFWFDGNWSRPDVDWKEDRLYSTIRKYQPQAIIVNNTGLSARGALGHPEIDSVTFEQGTPEPMNREGMPRYIAAEMCQTFNQHWGIGWQDFNYLAPPQLIKNLCACRKVGANYLLNVGPAASGEIPDYERAVLKCMGKWIALYPDAVYNAKPTVIKTQAPDFALEHGDSIYLFIHGLGIKGCAHVTLDSGSSGNRIFRNFHRQIASARWLDSGEQLKFTQGQDGTLALEPTGYDYGTDLVVRIAQLSCS